MNSRFFTKPSEAKEKEIKAINGKEAKEKPAVSLPGSILLFPDAFLPANEIKVDIDKSALKLVHNDEPFYTYITNAKEQHIIDKNKCFVLQFSKIFYHIREWYEKNNNEKKDDLVNQNILTLKGFPDYFFNSASQNQQSFYFEQTKLYCEFILLALQNNNIPNDRKRSTLNKLISNLYMCGPGLFGHIESAYLSMISPVSLISWLAEFRTDLIHLLAEKHIAKKNITDSNAMHAHNVILAFASSDKCKYAPTTHIAKIDEHFKKLALFKNNDEEQFQSNFLREYNLRTIADFIATKFHEKWYESCKFNGWIKDKSGWIKPPKENQLQEIIETASNLWISLGLKKREASYFDSNEDDTALRFNAEHFKRQFYQYCMMENALVNDKHWQRTNLTSKYQLAHIKHPHFYRSLHWIEDKDARQVSFDDIPKSQLSEVAISYFTHCIKLTHEPDDAFGLMTASYKSALSLSEKEWMNVIFALISDNEPTDYVDFFEIILERDPDKLAIALATINDSQKITALFDALNADFVLIHPKHALHKNLKKSIELLYDKNKELGKVFTAFQKNLDTSYQSLAAACNKANTAKSESKENKEIGLCWSDLLAIKDDQIKTEHHLIYRAYSKKFYRGLLPDKNDKEINYVKIFRESLRIESPATSFLRDGNLQKIKKNNITFNDFIFDQRPITWLHGLHHQSLGDYFYQQVVTVKSTQELSFSCDPQTSISNAPLLYWAVLYNQPETVSLLLTNPNIAPNTTNFLGETPLHVSTMHGLFASTKKLCAHPAININATDTNFNCPIHNTVIYDQLHILKYLCTQPNININQQGENGNTALHLAVIDNNIQMVKYLCSDPRIDILAVNDARQCPMDIAKDKCHMSIFRYLMAVPLMYFMCIKKQLTMDVDTQKTLKRTIHSWVNTQYKTEKSPIAAYFMQCLKKSEPPFIDYLCANMMIEKQNEGKQFGVFLNDFINNDTAMKHLSSELKKALIDMHETINTSKNKITLKK